MTLHLNIAWTPLIILYNILKKEEVTKGNRKMAHDCRLRSLEVHENEEGYLFVKDQCNRIGGKEHFSRVEYCPVCGMKAKKSSVLGISVFPRTDIANSDESIIDYTNSMGRCFRQMNENLEVFKNFIQSQNVQNQCFMDRDLQTSQELNRLRELTKINQIVIDDVMKIVNEISFNKDK